MGAVVAPCFLHFLDNLRWRILRFRAFLATGEQISAFMSYTILKSEENCITQYKNIFLHAQDLEEKAIKRRDIADAPRSDRAHCLFYKMQEGKSYRACHIPDDRGKNALQKLGTIKLYTLTMFDRHYFK